MRSFISEKIPFYRGLRKIASLPVRPLVDSLRAELVARGRQYVKLAGLHHMQCASRKLGVGSYVRPRHPHRRLVQHDGP